MDIEKIKASFQLMASHITKFQLDNDFYYYNSLIDAERKIDVSYILQDITKDEETGEHYGTIVLNLMISVESDKSEFQMEICSSGTFSADAELSDEVFRRMLTLNGCSVLYTLTRAKIASVTSQIFEDGCIMLPLVNFVKFRELNQGRTSKKKKVTAKEKISAKD
jgi:preprotein translocase subunit SecB